MPTSMKWNIEMPTSMKWNVEKYIEKALSPLDAAVVDEQQPLRDRPFGFYGLWYIQWPKFDTAVVIAYAFVVGATSASLTAYLPVGDNPTPAGKAIWSADVRYVNARPALDELVELLKEHLR
jgi:hypothetical protein